MLQQSRHLFDPDSEGKRSNLKKIGKLLGGILLVISPLIALNLMGNPSLPDPEVSQDYRGDSFGRIPPGNSIGQSLRIQRDNINGILFWLDPAKENTMITLEVFPSSGEGNPIFSSTFYAQEGANKIKIKPSLSSDLSPLYFRLKTIQGENSVFGRDENAYPDGIAYRDDLPMDGDLAFRTTYAYDGAALLSDLNQLIKHWYPLAAMFALLFIPGWLVLDVLQIRKIADGAEQAALSVGLSLSLLSVLMIWTTTFHLRWTQEAVFIGAGVLTATFLWRMGRMAWKYKAASKKHPDKHFPKPHTWILIGIFLSSFVVRMAMVRDLDVPPWVDSIHHALITQGIIQTGEIPANYLPHIPLDAQYYHPGYHSILAAYHWLSGLEIPQAMLFLGQGLNALSVFAVYAFTTALVKDKTAGILAAAITGLFSAMPAYYTSWGRYTQLTGLIILPTTLFLFQKIPAGKPKYTWLLAAGLSLGGLIMVHYRVAFMAGCLFLATWVSSLFQRGLDSSVYFRTSFMNTLFAGCLSILITTPWLLPSIQQFLLPAAQTWQSAGNPTIPPIHWQYFTQAGGAAVLVAAGLGVVSGIIKRKTFALILLIWVGLLFAAANPRFLHIPFPSGLINQTSVEIMLFIPLAVFAGVFLSDLLASTATWLKFKSTFFWKATFTLFCIEIAIIGSFQTLPILNPDTFLFRKDDHTAIRWIEEHVPEGETIVINPTAWGYGLYRGEDGGYWISPLTDHPTMPPNVLYGFNEEQKHTVNQFVEMIFSADEDPEAISALMKDYGYKTIFIGSSGGTLSPRALEESTLFTVRYHQGTNWIFETVESP